MIESLMVLVSALAGFLVSHFYHKYDNRKSKHEKAIEVAREFERILSSGILRIDMIHNEIVNNLDIIDSLSFLEEDINSIEFDIKEAEKYIGKNKLNEYDEFQSPFNTKFVKILAEYYQGKDRYLNYIIREFDDDLNIKENFDKLKIKLKGDQSKLEIDDLKLLRDLKAHIKSLFSDFMEKKWAILNKFEWISMYFVTGIADSDFVYQSLHQTYFAIVKVFYLDISKNNNRESYNKYYTNIASLYKDWRIKYNFKKEQHDKHMRKINAKNKIRGKV